MPSASFFASLGLFVLKNFLDAELCSDLRLEMQAASGSPATVGITQEEIVDETVRHVTWAKVSSESKSLLGTRLLGVQTELALHFGVALNGFEKPQFLVYREGCFYAQHQDSSEDAAALDYIKSRKISVVIFLNDESETPKEEYYGGGQLTFFGLLKDEPWQKCGLPLAAEAGLLVAFCSDIQHEVQPVIHGTRYTIVTWYF